MWTACTKITPLSKTDCWNRPHMDGIDLRDANLSSNHLCWAEFFVSKPPPPKRHRLLPSWAHYGCTTSQIRRGGSLLAHENVNSTNNQQNLHSKSTFYCQNRDPSLFATVCLHWRFLGWQRSGGTPSGHMTWHTLSKRLVFCQPWPNFTIIMGSCFSTCRYYRCSGAIPTWPTSPRATGQTKSDRGISKYYAKMAANSVRTQKQFLPSQKQNSPKFWSIEDIIHHLPSPWLSPKSSW